MRTWMPPLLIALALAACNGGGSGGGDQTPVATQTVAASSTPAPIPDRPAALDGYAAAVAQYLGASPDAGAGSACLSDLYQAWSMPYFSGDRSCRAGNTDADADDEVAAVLVEAAEGACVDPIRFEVAVFDKRDGGYAVAYESPQQMLSCADANWLGNVILAAEDLNGDDTGELAYGVRTCGAHTCSTAVHIVQGATTGYAPLTPDTGLTIDTPTRVEFADTDGDGAKELLLTGGVIGSVGAGPQRERIDVYAWDGTSYALRSSTPADATYLYHAILDADALLAAGDYDGAEAAFIAAIDDGTLRTWEATPERNERAELTAYARFRAGLAALLAGRKDAAALQFEAGRRVEGTLHAQLSGSFQAGYAAKGEIGVGCAAANEDVRANLAEYEAFWDYGYANPVFDPAKVCPY